MIKMIFVDLDGTLLRSDSTMSDYTVDTLKRCQDAEIKVAFATARSTKASQRFIDRFAPDVFIGYGGALVMVGDKVIQRLVIPADTAGALIGACLRAPEITGIHAINEFIALSNARDPDMRHYQHTDFAGRNEHDFLKISVIASNPAVVEGIASRFPICDMLRYTGEDLYRFANREAVKWTGVMAAAGYYGFGVSELAAFGDDVNDLEMIQNCGTGVAMANAVDAVLAAAGHVCDTNDNDGVAKWIDEHILHTRGGSEANE